MRRVASGTTETPNKETTMTHPNATAAAGTGGLGVFAVYLLGLVGVNPPAEVAVAGVATVTTVFLFVGKVGIKGTIKRIWTGVGG